MECREFEIAHSKFMTGLKKYFKGNWFEFELVVNLSKLTVYECKDRVKSRGNWTF